MKILFKSLLLIALISYVSSTINPSKNKKGKQKTQEPKAVKVKKGPQEKSVYERNLVESEPLASDIITEAYTYYRDTTLKNFNGTVLGYVTPVTILLILIISCK